jgi:hypothetical protein
LGLEMRIGMDADNFQDIPRSLRTPASTIPAVRLYSFIQSHLHHSKNPTESHTDSHVTVLLEAPYRKGHLRNSVLLTVDLTKGVADEAIRRKDSIIIAYRQSIFHLLHSHPLT